MTLERLRAPLLGLMLCVGGRSVKRWQQIEKRLKRKASEHLKHRWLGGNPGKCQHLVSPLLLDQDRYHTIAALFPIKSIVQACLNTQSWAGWWKAVIQWTARVDFDRVFIDNANFRIIVGTATSSAVLQ